MVLKFHEQQVCEAIIRHVEARENSQRQNVRYPEKEGHEHRVEVAWTCTDRLFALEHTGIEPFDGFIELNNEAEARLGPIQSAANDSLPPDTFELHIPLKALQAPKGAELKAAQKAIADWVASTGPQLKCTAYADYDHGSRSVTLEGVGFPIELHRFESAGVLQGLQFRHVRSGDGKQERAARILRACEKKFPKLAGWKHEGARSILVLENNDIQLSNQAVIAETYLPIATAREDRPDETYLVDTCTSKWHSWPLLVDDRTYFDFARADKRPFWKITP